MLGTGLADFGFKALCAAGDAAVERADMGTALRCFGEALEIRRTSYVLGRIAATWRDLGDLPRAVSNARESLTLDAENRWASAVLIAALCDASEWDDAVREAQQAVRKHPADVALHQVALRALEGQLSSLKADGVTGLVPHVALPVERGFRAMRRQIQAARASSGESASRPRSGKSYSEAIRRIGLAIDPGVDALRRESRSSLGERTSSPYGGTSRCGRFEPLSGTLRRPVVSRQPA